MGEGHCPLNILLAVHLGDFPQFDIMNYATSQLLFCQRSVIMSREIGTTGTRGAQAPYILTGGPCPCYFVPWHLLIKVTKDE